MTISQRRTNVPKRDLRRKSQRRVAPKAILAFETLEVRRVCSAGALDTIFNGTGLQTVDVASTAPGGLLLIKTTEAIQSDGKIVLASSYIENSVVTVSRLNSDGSIDSSFGTDGIAQLSVSQGQGLGTAEVAVQADGKIVIIESGNASGVSGSSSSLIFVVRLNSDGTLDTTFNGTGEEQISIGSGVDPVVNAIATQPDGKIVLAGTANNDFFAARLTTSLTLDTTFNNKGYQVVPVVIQGSAQKAAANAVAIASSGEIVLAGTANVGITSSDFAIAALNSDGSLNSSFGSGGVATVDFQPIDGYFSMANAVAIQSNGEIVVAGSSQLPSIMNMAVARLTADGTLDTSFDGNGLQTVAFTNPSYNDNASAVNAVAIQTDG
jgi:uncharacterized delta-60 repeat protein